MFYTMIRPYAVCTQFEIKYLFKINRTNEFVKNIIFVTFKNNKYVL